ncbi:MAG: glucosaminidase domain-containing protein [Bacteroidales bacterium]|nr:glucosaminidase domain-containing protein [Bacteroidales bacterium]
MNCRTIISIILIAAATMQLQAQNLTRQQYINKYKDVAIKQMHKHKIPASIILAQACLESGDGNSTLARKANNHFGIKCHNGWKGKGYKHDDDAKGECFRKYNDPIDSFTDHSYFLISGSRYNSLFDLPITDYKAWAHGLKAAGYATNPKYAKLLIDIIEEYKLYKYDTGEAFKESKAQLKAAKKEAKLQKKMRKLEKKAAKAARKSEKAKIKLEKLKGTAPAAAPETAPVQPTAQPEAQPAPKTEQPTAPVGETYTIKAGDTLYSIARRYGTTVDEITRLNPGLKATELKIGTQIRIK